MSRDDFSLLHGGPAYRLLHGIGLLRPEVATAPVTRRNPLVFALSAALPLVPVVFVAMSFDEVARRLLSIIA